MTEPKRTVYEKLASAISEVERIGRDGTNEHFRYKYTSAEQVYRVIRGPLLEQGLVVIPSIEDAKREGQVTSIRMRLRIVDTDSGDEIEAFWVGEGQDKGDKASFKAATGGMKTWLKHLFLLPADDDPESDPETDRRAALLDRLHVAADKCEMPRKDRAAVAEWMNNGGSVPKMDRLVIAVERLEAGEVGVLGEIVSRA